MGNKTIFGIVAVLAVLVVIGFGAAAFLSNNQSNNQNNGAVFSMAQIEQANTQENCLVVYSNKVYKVSSEFIDEHEGGSEEILNYCGKDLTTVFNDNPEHDRSALRQLEDFYVGELN